MKINNAFREKFKTQMRQIFGVKNIEFDVFNKGKELHTLFVDVDKIETTVITGAVGYIMSGTFAMGVEEAIGDDFFIHKKYNVSKKTQGLSIGKNEVTVKYEDHGQFFVKNSVDFIYSGSGEFNSPYGKMTAVNF